MRLISLCVAALLLAGCANIDIGGTPSGGASPRPKTIVVSDFVFASEVVALDRGYTARLERKIGTLPDPRAQAAHARAGERRDRGEHRGHAARSRARGAARQRGGAFAQRRRGGGQRPAARRASNAKPKQIGFGAGRGGVVADMTLSHLSSGGKKQLASFTAESARKAAAAPASRNAAIIVGGRRRRLAGRAAVARRRSAGARARPRRRREDRRLCARSRAGWRSRKRRGGAGRQARQTGAAEAREEAGEARGSAEAGRRAEGLMLAVMPAKAGDPALCGCAALSAGSPLFAGMTASSEREVVTAPLSAP